MGQEKLHSLLFLWLSLWAEQSCPNLVSASLVTPPKDMYIALGHLFSHRRTPQVPARSQPCGCVRLSPAALVFQLQIIVYVLNVPTCSPSTAEPAWVMCEGP